MAAVGGDGVVEEDGEAGAGELARGVQRGLHDDVQASCPAEQEAGVDQQL